MRAIVLVCACAALLLLSAGVARADPTVTARPQLQYDRSPKIRIQGTGFTETGKITATFDPDIREGKEYMLSKSDGDDGLVLKLLTNQKWADLGPQQSVYLVMTALKFESLGDRNLLPESVPIAKIIPTPTVKPSDQLVYQSASLKLRINGTALDAGKFVDLYFDPPLFKELDYEMGPMTSTSVTILLRDGSQWRKEPGPLYLFGIDTGAGPIKLGDEQGILVAEVQANLDRHGVTVEENTQPIYHDQASLTIKGMGFSPSTTATRFRFGNGLLGSGRNFTLTSCTGTTAQLSLTSGSFWRRNTANLPGPLTLLAVDAGEGFVAVGASNAKKGRTVATVFERPTVFPSAQHLFRTHSHHLVISGRGFVKQPNGVTQLLFDPALNEGVDYTVQVDSREQLTVILADGRAWRKDAGLLKLLAINTLGVPEGIVRFPNEGVHVAEIVDDTPVEQTGGVSIQPTVSPVYRSASHESIVVTGSGFQANMRFVMEPATLTQEKTFDVVYESPTSVRLVLKEGQNWGEPGSVLVKKVFVDGKEYDMAQGTGIRVATIYSDPKVIPTEAPVFESFSKAVMIKGSGFTNLESTSVILSPTYPGSYEVSAVSPEAIIVHLREGYDWVPDIFPLEDDTKIPLKVSSINTGAGEVSFPEPIVIGQIQKDRAEHYCDDSCEFAFDGLCDDGSTNIFQQYSYYAYDDDYGGYYQEEENAYFDDYYIDDQYTISACLKGTDCTDCGGVPGEAPAPEQVCTNSCPFARDGICDDPRGQAYCEMGTDCQDCGPVGASNYTAWDDDGWWDDDDDYWDFNDNTFLDQAKGLDANRHRIKSDPFIEDNKTPAAVFITVLEGMVYTVGSLIAAFATFIFIRWYKGHRIPFLQMFDPQSGNIQSDVEMSARPRGPITPDVIRT